MILNKVNFISSLLNITLLPKISVDEIFKSFIINLFNYHIQICKFPKKTELGLI